LALHCGTRLHGAYDAPGHRIGRVHMKVTRVTPILNVADVGASIEWFESLGWQRSFCWNDGGAIAHASTRDEHGPANFGGVCAEEAEIFLCRDAQGHRPGRLANDVRSDKTGGVWMSWWLEAPADVDELYLRAKQLGYDIPLAPVDEPWGVREFHLRHPDGHTVRVSAGTTHD
jgi:uncharacterized glyoxalase superfamily protein PhnB